MLSGQSIVYVQNGKDIFFLVHCYNSQDILAALSSSFMFSESHTRAVSSAAQFKLFIFPFQDTQASRMDHKQSLAIEKQVPGCHVVHLL